MWLCYVAEHEDKVAGTSEHYEYVEEFVCITPPSPRKLEAVELAKHLQSKGAKATPCDTIAEGVRLAVEKAGKDGVVLCFGSLYTIGAIKEALDASSAK